MSLVENLINQITTQGLGGITKPQGFDLGDDTFSKLLNQQMNASADLQPSNFVGEMGRPAGFVIEPFDGIDFSETAQDQIEALGESKLTNEEYLKQPIEIKDLDMGDYFSNLLKSSSDKNSNFMNFAKKHASNTYNLLGKNLVTNITEFVDDIASAG